jgi:hypothetical protein
LNRRPRRRSTRVRAIPQSGEEYFKQLTAERLVTRIVKGFPRGCWEKEPGRALASLRSSAAVCPKNRAGRGRVPAGISL